MRGAVAALDARMSGGGAEGRTEPTEAISRRCLIVGTEVAAADDGAVSAEAGREGGGGTA